MVFAARGQPLAARMELDSPYRSFVPKVSAFEASVASQRIALQIPEADCPVIRSCGKAEAIWRELDAAYGMTTSLETMQNISLSQAAKLHHPIIGSDR